MNVVIITARAGSKSIINKNTMDVKDQPLIVYPIRASIESDSIDKIFISTDGDVIAKIGKEMGCEIIHRPEDLCGDTVNHGDVIKHAVEYVDNNVSDLENVVVLLGNTVMIDGDIIDLCLTKLDNERDLDSVMTVWEAADDHPNRALEIKDGVLVPYGDVERDASTERQSYKKAYYYDQGIWAFRKGCVKHKSGPNPWWWMGKRSAALIRNWVTGRDIHTLLDVSFSEHWLSKYPEIKKL
jgi:CMP-N-acetylneuraminic acid synthetase